MKKVSYRAYLEVRGGRRQARVYADQNDFGITEIASSMH